MKKATIIRITNPSNESVYIVNDRQLGEAIRNEGIIDIKRATLLHEKTRTGKQVATSEIEYNLVQNQYPHTMEKSLGFLIEELEDYITGDPPIPINHVPE